MILKKEMITDEKIITTLRDITPKMIELIKEIVLNSGDNEKVITNCGAIVGILSVLNALANKDIKTLIKLEKEAGINTVMYNNEIDTIM